MSNSGEIFNWKNHTVVVFAFVDCTDNYIPNMGHKLKSHLVSRRNAMRYTTESSGIHFR